MSLFTDLLDAVDSPLLAYLDMNPLPKEEQPGLDSRYLLPIFGTDPKVVPVAPSSLQAR